MSSSGAAGHLGLAMCLRDDARRHISAGWLRAGGNRARQLDGGANGREEGLRVGGVGREGGRGGEAWELRRGLGCSGGSNGGRGGGGGVARVARGSTRGAPPVEPSKNWLCRN